MTALKEINSCDHLLILCHGQLTVLALAYSTSNTLSQSLSVLLWLFISFWPLLSDHSPKCLLSVIKQNNFLVLSGGRSKILMGSIQQEVCGAAGAG